MDDGLEHPIGFASRTLTPAESRYSQLDKEALAIIVGVKHFHQYIYGRKFTCVTDHKPLLGLLHETKAVPQMASPRVLRWSLTLATYDYRLQYKAGNKNGNSDAMSRLLLKTKDEPSPTPGDVVLLMDHLSASSAVTADAIRLGHYVILYYQRCIN